MKEILSSKKTWALIFIVLTILSIGVPTRAIIQNILSGEDSNTNPKKVKKARGINDEINDDIYEGLKFVLSASSEKINVKNASYLNANRDEFLNVSKEVISLDEVWSEKVDSGGYVRVSFEQKLTNKNDITIYPRVISGNPRIEVYEVGGIELIAEFSSLRSNQYNKVFLTNLTGEQDTFDLKIINGSIEIDHIVDPIESVFSDDFETDLTKWDGNGATAWDLTTAQFNSGAQSLQASNGNEDDVITDDIDTSDATFVNVSFWFRDNNLDAGDIDLYFFDGVAYDAITETLETQTAEDVWAFAYFETSDSQYFKTNFRVRFNAVLGNGENIWIDDFFVNKTTDGPPQSSSNMTNSTFSGQTILHSVLWTDDVALAGYIFSFDNGTGTFANDSWTSMIGTTNWSNVSKVVNSTVGSTIGWIVYANDSSNKWNVTSTFQYATTEGPTDSCACIADTDWTIINGDQCTLSSSCNLGTGKLRIMDGRLVITSTGVLNSNGCFIRDSASLFVIDTGKLVCR